MFYMAFENANCDEYITEKAWWNAYHKNAIPIVMGASEGSYRRILPPYSYINVDEFASPRDLATYLRYLNNTPNEFLKYFQWKKYFKVLNEHGYFQSESFHYCRVCEALNYNGRDTKVYNDLKSFWSVERDCHPGWMWVSGKRENQNKLKFFIHTHVNSNLFYLFWINVIIEL